MRQIQISDFMTEKMIKAAFMLGKVPGHARHRLFVELLKPHMDEINRKLGQENDVNYLAYAVEYAISVARAEAE